MKILLGMMLLSLLPGCLDIYFTTEIKPGGEIVKTIVLEGDSTEILDSYLPVIHNETWERKWADGKDDQVKLILEKTFRNSREARTDLNPSDSLPLFRLEPELKRRFRWFFTYYRYTETILATNPFDQLSWEDYLSREEIELAVMDEELREKDARYDEESYAKTEEKLEEYLIRSGFEEFYQLFLQALRETPDISLTEEDVARQKETLLAAVRDSSNNDRADGMITLFSQVLGTDDPLLIYERNQQKLDWFNHKIEYFENAFDDNMHFTVRMPGLLIDTNSNKIEGTSLTWAVDSFDAFFIDLVMTAESRMVNNWSFAATGILLLILILMFFREIRRRKKMS